jgi:hypothetical protein
VDLIKNFYTNDIYPQICLDNISGTFREQNCGFIASEGWSLNGERRSIQSNYESFPIALSLMFSEYGLGELKDLEFFIKN